MAQNKFLVKNGLQTQNISFKDSAEGLNEITASMLGTDTLSFSGDVGQLFSISDTLSGTIFAVNDISGVPSIEVDDTGEIRLAETFGYVLIGTDSDKNSAPLQVNGNIYSNGTITASSFSGSGSSLTGVDADTVDGIQGASFLRSDADDTKTGNIVLQTSGAVTDTTTGLFFETGGSYDDGRYRTRFRKQDVGGGIPLYIDQSSSTANSYTAQARFGTYSGNDYEFEVFGDMKANGDVAATGAFNFSSNSGDVIEYDGSTFMKRLTTNGGTRIGKDDILILGAGEAASTIESNTTHSAETVYIGGESGIVFISSPDNWATGWSGRNEMVYNTSGDLSVPGALSATTKSFDIEHPTKEGMRLRYGSLEGPENGVYVRGRLKDNNTIELPDYWTGLVYEDTITVNLTAIGRSQDIWVEDITDNKVIVGGANVNCFYTVYAERKDVERFEVEYNNES